ncbi:unnamed protein product [Vitrella brassicaformis CCMP3155]|uniref:Uncharacterized protein n=5 Tax=Vitrella brassicaformis TaxID=1169539 RepID=A0A0G4EU58_VITBC|nr:unnamed protein product [Vitrella brassicaformis CCMP3155]|eukprot:CEM01802.1 unnamed protein product [Vitrella brassicaformis CCMP3155]
MRQPVIIPFDELQMAIKAKAAATRTPAGAVPSHTHVPPVKLAPIDRDNIVDVEKGRKRRRRRGSEAMGAHEVWRRERDLSRFYVERQLLVEGYRSMMVEIRESMRRLKAARGGLDSLPQAAQSQMKLLFGRRGAAQFARGITSAFLFSPNASAHHPPSSLLHDDYDKVQMPSPGAQTTATSSPRNTYSICHFRQQQQQQQQHRHSSVQRREERARDTTRGETQTKGDEEHPVAPPFWRYSNPNAAFEKKKEAERLQMAASRKRPMKITSGGRPSRLRLSHPLCDHHVFATPAVSAPRPSARELRAQMTINQWPEIETHLPPDQSAMHREESVEQSGSEIETTTSGDEAASSYRDNHEDADDRRPDVDERERQQPPADLLRHTLRPRDRERQQRAAGPSSRRASLSQQVDSGLRRSIRSRGGDEVVNEEMLQQIWDVCSARSAFQQTRKEIPPFPPIPTLSGKTEKLLKSLDTKRRRKIALKRHKEAEAAREVSPSLAVQLNNAFGDTSTKQTRSMLSSEAKERSPRERRNAMAADQLKEQLDKAARKDIGKVAPRASPAPSDAARRIDASGVPPNVPPVALHTPSPSPLESVKKVRRHGQLVMYRRAVLFKRCKGRLSRQLRLAIEQKRKERPQLLRRRTEALLPRHLTTFEEDMAVLRGTEVRQRQRALFLLKRQKRRFDKVLHKLADTERNPTRGELFLSQACRYELAAGLHVDILFMGRCLRFLELGDCADPHVHRFLGALCWAFDINREALVVLLHAHLMSTRQQQPSTDLGGTHEDGAQSSASSRRSAVHQPSPFHPQHTHRRREGQQAADETLFVLPSQLRYEPEPSTPSSSKASEKERWPREFEVRRVLDSCQQLDMPLVRYEEATKERREKSAEASSSTSHWEYDAAVRSSPSFSSPPLSGPVSRPSTKPHHLHPPTSPRRQHTMVPAAATAARRMSMTAFRTLPPSAAPPPLPLAHHNINGSSPRQRTSIMSPRRGKTGSLLVTGQPMQRVD